MPYWAMFCPDFISNSAVSMQKIYPFTKEQNYRASSKRFASQLDLSMAVFADCKIGMPPTLPLNQGSFQATSPKTCNNPSCINFHLLPMTPHFSKRKLKLPVEMANALQTSGDTVYVSTSGTDNASCGRAIAPCKNFWDRLWPMPTPMVIFLLTTDNMFLHPRLPSIKPDPHRRFQQWSAHPHQSFASPGQSALLTSMAAASK